MLFKSCSVGGVLEIENNGKMGIFSEELYFFSILYTVDSIWFRSSSRFI